MLLLLHGAAGAWDEIAVAVVALGVLWITVKLAGRKPASDDDNEEVASTEEVASKDVLVEAGEEATRPAHASHSKPY